MSLNPISYIYCYIDVTCPTLLSRPIAAAHVTVARLTLLRVHVTFSTPNGQGWVKGHTEA